MMVVPMNSRMFGQTIENQSRCIQFPNKIIYILSSNFKRICIFLGVINSISVIFSHVYMWWIFLGCASEIIFVEMCEIAKLVQFKHLLLAFKLVHNFLFRHSLSNPIQQNVFPNLKGGGGIWPLQCILFLFPLKFDSFHI